MSEDKDTTKYTYKRYNAIRGKVRVEIPTIPFAEDVCKLQSDNMKLTDIQEFIPQCTNEIYQTLQENKYYKARLNALKRFREKIKVPKTAEEMRNYAVAILAEISKKGNKETSRVQAAKALFECANSVRQESSSEKLVLPTSLRKDNA